MRTSTPAVDTRQSSQRPWPWIAFSSSTQNPTPGAALSCCSAKPSDFETTRSRPAEADPQRQQDEPPWPLEDTEQHEPDQREQRDRHRVTDRMRRLVRGAGAQTLAGLAYLSVSRLRRYGHSMVETWPWANRA